MACRSNIQAGGVEAQDLVDDPTRVLQALEIGEHRLAVTQNLAHFIKQPSLDVRVLREQVPSKAERVGGRFVTRERQGEHLVA